MRTPRLIAILVCWCVAVTALYLALATAVPRSAIVLLFLAGFGPYLLWLRLEPYFERHRTSPESDSGSADTGADAEAPRCARCGRAIVADPDFSRDALEGMHWLCFHLEFEHKGDADLPCSDPGCPHWIRQVYEGKLRELGVDPREVLDAAIAERYR